MEKVQVIKAIPGMLKVGDILISPEAGSDFCLEEVEVSKRGSNERYVSLDYITVSENVPNFFEFVLEDECESECFKCGKCEECDCNWTKEELKEQDIRIPGLDIMHTEEEIRNRYNFFYEQYKAAEPGSESQIVYRNLMWFIEWMYGKAELI